MIIEATKRPQKRIPPSEIPRLDDETHFLSIKKTIKPLKSGVKTFEFNFTRPCSIFFDMAIISQPIAIKKTTISFCTKHSRFVRPASRNKCFDREARFNQILSILKKAHEISKPPSRKKGPPLTSKQIKLEHLKNAVMEKDPEQNFIELAQTLQLTRTEVKKRVENWRKTGDVYYQPKKKKVLSQEHIDYIKKIFEEAGHVISATEIQKKGL